MRRGCKAIYEYKKIDSLADNQASVTSTFDDESSSASLSEDNSIPNDPSQSVQNQNKLKPTISSKMPGGISQRNLSKKKSTKSMRFQDTTAYKTPVFDNAAATKVKDIKPDLLKATSSTLEEYFNQFLIQKIQTLSIKFLGKNFLILMPLVLSCID